MPRPPKLLAALLAVLLALCLPPAAMAERDLRLFFFGNAQVHDPAGGDGASVPYWLARLAAAGGHGLAADGRSGLPADFARDLPPPPGWQVAGLARAMSDNPRSFRMAGFDTVVLAPSAGAADDAAALADPVGRTFDWAANQGPARFFLYDGWAAIPPDRGAQGWQDWLAAGADAHPAWHRGLADRLRARLPEAEIAVIPVSATLAALLSADGVLADPGPAAFFSAEGDQPGPGLYLIAAMATYAALYAEPPPPLDLPATIPAALRDRQAAVAAAVWQVAGGAVPPAAASAPPATAAAGEARGLADPSIGFGLNGISDWSAQQPFLDVMKTARRWIGHTPTQWGAVGFDDLQAGGFIGPDGWPLAIPEGVTALEALILTDMPPEAAGLAGSYVLRWQGTGTVGVAGRATETARAEREIRFDYAPGDGAVAVAISATDPADPVRDITVVQARHLPLHAAGALFNPDWLAAVADARVLRFMDWMQANDPAPALWSERPLVTDFTWGWRGVPAEVMVDLANQIGADPWFTLPHTADDAYVAAFAALVRDRLDPRLVVHAEWSNEVWNWIFPQAQWAADQARLRWGAEGGDAWMQFAGTRAAEVADIWAAAFAGQEGRLVRVVGVQTGWPGLEQALLDAPLRQAEGLPPPAASFDAYAVTGYFGHEIGEDSYSGYLRAWIADGSATERVTRTLREGSFRALVTELWPYHAQAAADRGLTLMMYEGGTHVVGLGAVTEDAAITGFMTAYNYGPEMAALYADLLAAWRDLGPPGQVGPFNAFVDVARPSRWGSWGALRHLDDVNPRWATLAAWNALPFGDPARAPGTFLHGAILTGDGEITGTPRADVLIGGAGDDVIVTLGGDDRVLGGGGRDRAVLPGVPADWTPAFEGEALWMEGPQGSLRLTGIAEIAFSGAPSEVMTLAPPQASAAGLE